MKAHIVVRCAKAREIMRLVELRTKMKCGVPGGRCPHLRMTLPRRAA